MRGLDVSGGVSLTRPLRMLRILLPRRGKTSDRVPRLTKVLIAALALELFPERDRGQLSSVWAIDPELGVKPAYDA